MSGRTVDKRFVNDLIRENPPYVKDGRDPGRNGGIDCLGAIQEVYRHHGIDLGDYEELMAAGLAAMRDGALLELVEDPEPLDIVAFESRDTAVQDHVGVMLDRKRFLHVTHQGLCVNRVGRISLIGRFKGFYRWKGDRKE